MPGETAGLHTRRRVGKALLMKTYGLTGGIGMGKSTAADWLEQQGVPIIDTDLIARQLVEPRQPAWAEIQTVFGKGLINADGNLNRAALAERVFTDLEARRILETILHPRIRRIWQARAAELTAEGRPVVVVVIPLLFETDAASSFDATICVACSPATQRSRLLARGWSEEQIQQRNEAQWPVEKKMTLADYVVWTEGGLDVLGEQLRRIFGMLIQEPPPKNLCPR